MTHVHLIGIGGSGLSAIARLLLESGYSVSGSDRILSDLAHELAEAGATVYTGHAPENVRGADIVVRSSAIPDANPEVQAALAAGIPVLKRSDFLGRLMSGRVGIAVAGTHGKTTTTSMLAWLLTACGKDPSYIIGGVSKNLGNNAHAGRGSAFVIEADEYDRMFLGLNPQIAVVTVMEHDHPDCYPTPEDYRAAFVDFVHRLQPGGLLITNADNAETSGLAAEIPAGCRVIRYGLDENADLRAVNVHRNDQGGFSFRAPAYAGEITLQVPGEHNVRNALAALAVTRELKIDDAAVAAALANFKGTGRRFDVRGEVDGITIVDDYAHHPTEIRATLAAARSRYQSRRIWAVWQPHTYSRTQTLLPEFARAFGDADRVIVTAVYAAREKDNGFSAAQVVDRMQHSNARFIPALADVRDTLLAELQPGDVLLVLSAGDADQISTQVLTALGQKEEGHV
ncbi:UDP-N-acetylmuramate--L-alanine ligase [Longilinea arvoryzae]|uniref:UDP-N-acetylmuramate--L-alanine ligase n=1 Tax=Longilinea arvoryzae TaxID=360412 RepID=A0A0S7BI54_9CHLR|nr:UDP-N-acetylmuramate--L-alanine ligase [Longilinea arvoryzae]GAP14275.1 UDP-N-acetylmuramate--L-alanine ligase [Longilinea arvoryzae]